MVQDTDDDNATDESAGDLGYDLAHEGAAAAAADARSGHPQHAQAGAPVMHTDDNDGDYGYDLAHDVPGR